MSSGRDHFRMAVVATAVGIPTVYYLFDSESATWISTGMIIGIFANPDVRDIENSTYITYVIEKVPIVGKILSWAFECFWFPLARAVPHRSKLSHWPIVGTSVAWFYSLGILAVLALIFTNTPVLVFLDASLVLPSSLGVLIGWCLQDCVHFSMDVLHSFFVKRRRKRTRALNRRRVFPVVLARFGIF